MKTLTPLLPNGSPDPSKTTGFSVVPGDRVHGTFWGGEALLEILENGEERMRWKGVWHGLVAVRCFEWAEVEIDAEATGERQLKGTRFTQSEEAKGFMGGVLVVDGWLGGNLKKKFDRFGEDLRVWCEDLERRK